ncbi:MAG: type II toxin-antitoxin system PemK/MazF family toxin [Planctomycetes bacterium]|nr:type II toxin-antitoxin system PemK/MazF family toxin [Planctomycetota bacterium]
MTKTGTRPRQGDIVLIPIPFTDLASHKRRPLIVISNDGYNRAVEDIVVVAMTSSPAFGPYAAAEEEE